jgi:hypothetical protein
LKRNSYPFHGQQKRKVRNYAMPAGQQTLPKSVGGLGVGSLRDKNKALLFKWLWRFGSKESSMWKDVITSIHNPNCSKLIPRAHILGAGTTWTHIVLKTTGYRLL